MGGSGYLMKGRETASTVRMNQDGCTMMSDFRFFRNLGSRGKASGRAELAGAASPVLPADLRLGFRGGG